MLRDPSSATPAPASRRQAPRGLHFLRAAAIVATLLGFAVAFNPEQSQLLVDGLWVVALGLWVSEIRSRCPGRFMPIAVRRRDLVPLAAILSVFVVAWLPFYGNWRWAYTGDSLAWFMFAKAAARGSLSHNLLSVHGVDDNFTYIHSLASNALLFLFEPNLLWHRVGKLIVSCLSLAAIYAYFTLTLGRWWAAAVVVATAANYVWLWFSYVSYGHIDSHIFYFLTLLLGTQIWRRPERLSQWMWCGLTAGCALFFTQTSWSAVAAVGLVLCCRALATRRVAAAVVYGVSFLLLPLPILLQFHDFLDMAGHQARAFGNLHYLARIFTTILELPYELELLPNRCPGCVLALAVGSAVPRRSRPGSARQHPAGAPRAAGADGRRGAARTPAVGCRPADGDQQRLSAALHQAGVQPHSVAGLLRPVAAHRAVRLERAAQSDTRPRPLP